MGGVGGAGGLGEGGGGAAGAAGAVVLVMVPGEPMSGLVKTPPGLQARAPWTPAFDWDQAVPTFIEAWDGLGM